LKYCVSTSSSRKFVVVVNEDKVGHNYSLIMVLIMI